MRDRRITRTKKSIQKAYLDLLKQKGTEKITISDIAREADIDRKTFYLHYDSTEDIIREYAEEKTRELLARLTIKSFFSLSFDRKIFAREVNSMLAEHLDFCRMIAGNPSLSFFWNEVQNVTVEQLFQLINERQIRGLSTVISTNLTLKELRERYTERIVSRLNDPKNCEIIVLKGKDLRKAGR